jgi:hypothetical protein
MPSSIQERYSIPQENKDLIKKKIIQYGIILLAYMVAGFILRVTNNNSHSLNFNSILTNVPTLHMNYVFYWIVSSVVIIRHMNNGFHWIGNVGLNIIVDY